MDVGKRTVSRKIRLSDSGTQKCLMTCVFKATGAAKRDCNQIRYFYESGKDVLWVTFFAHRLCWCFSEPKVTFLRDKSKTRPVTGQWSCMDVNGKLLERSQLSGRLLSMEGFRGTICSVKEFEYLVRKINGRVPREVEAAQAALSELDKKVETIIRRLHWKDFEILIDLIFRQAGCQRVSELGGVQKTLDLDLVSPITSEERYGVQIKSKANLADFEDYQRRFANMQDYRMFFVVHSPSDDLANSKETEDTKLWLPSKIAHMTVKYGLTDWVIARAS